MIQEYQVRQNVLMRQVQSQFQEIFSLTHDRAADVSVESFDQDINQANTCFLFDQCDNFGGNLFGIFAEDDDGILATGVDVEVGSSVQDVNQLNDCDGIFPPDPLCLNVGVNALGLSALEDGDVSLGESLQSVEQQNDCDNGAVACTTLDLCLDFRISYRQTRMDLMLK